MNGTLTATVTTTGAAGSATGTATLTLSGFIEGIRINWSASAPGTSDVTIVEQGGLGRTLYTKSDSAADVTFYPYLQGGDNAGAAITGVYGRVFVPYGPLLISVAGCDALAAALVVSIVVSDH